MRIPLHQIKAYSKCPAYASFSKKSKPVPESVRNKIISNVIKKCYVRHSQTGYRVPWRIILKWIDHDILKEINLKDDDAYDKAKSLADSIVVPVNHWYHRLYKKEEHEGYVNVPVSAIAGGCEIYDTVPIIKMSDPITIIIIDDIVNSQVQMYNDFKVRGLLWLVSRQLGLETLKAEHLLIGPTRALESTSIVCNKEMNKKIESSISHIAIAIRNNVCYPSITLMCNSCPYNKECSL